MLPRGLSDFQTRRFGEALDLVEHGAVSSLLLVRLLKRPKVKPSLAAFRKTLLKAYTATSEVFKYYTLEECEEEPLLLYLASAQHRENHLKKLGEKLLLEEELQSVSGVTKTLRNELKGDVDTSKEEPYLLFTCDSLMAGPIAAKLFEGFDANACDFDEEEVPLSAEEDAQVLSFARGRWFIFPSLQDCRGNVGSRIVSSLSELKPSHGIVWGCPCGRALQIEPWLFSPKSFGIQCWMLCWSTISNPIMARCPCAKKILDCGRSSEVVMSKHHVTMRCKILRPTIIYGFFAWQKSHSFEVCSWLCESFSTEDEFASLGKCGFGPS